jgi:hypothetical protein
MHNRNQIPWKSVIIIILSVFIGCSPPPSKSTVEEIVEKYFETRKYNVITLETGDIKPVPISQQQYMGTKGYMVHIPRLTLEVTEDSGAPWRYKKGQRLSFDNVSIRIRKSDNQERAWLITNIAGISVP